MPILKRVFFVFNVTYINIFACILLFMTLLRLYIIQPYGYKYLTRIKNIILYIFK